MASKEEFAGIDKIKHGKLIEFMTNNFRNVEIAGKQVIQTPDGEFIEYVLMEESYFVENWLVQFAIGHVGEKNYFNHQEWSRLTDGFTKGAIILNEDKQPVCLIRKFIDMDLGGELQHHMDHFARMASQAAHVPDKNEADEIIGAFANAVEQIASQNPDYDTLTAMIPYEYYLRHGIDPTVVKQCIWIRDNYTLGGEPIDADSDIMKAVEIVLYKHARGEPTTEKERNLVFHLTNGDFNFDGKMNEVDTQNSPAIEKPDDKFDPLAD
ncbi:hypothetical protein OBP_064 [Pseudomonas phage OBP]|jgi:hypothetical protein|uniref:hypothetical protein n=1 Tax=Pseudomonas phage OBP TaxID=1124849 RepID=UPI000240D41E|nr:hypothetical protein OBP_064 [Pseudomonas phage OBP]AEV89501.1 hypothetical protein OBP_064 [Pseudomonas phage OBP]